MHKHYPALIVAFVAAVLSMPGTYALLRAYDVLFKKEPNPARIVWSPHIALFWRLNVGLYVGGMIAFLVFMAARRDSARTIRVLYVGVFVVGALISIQGLLMP